MMNTIMLATMVSFRLGQVTLLASWRTCRTKAPGLVFAIFIPRGPEMNPGPF
jgi:hypothetical protein